MIHTIPVLVKLRARYPQARIDWFVTPENAEIVRCHPALSDTVLFARREYARFGRSPRATAGFFRLLSRLRHARYDLVIDLHGQLRSVFFALASGAPVRIGFDRPLSGKRARLREERARSSAEQSHSLDHTLANVPRRGWKGAREGSWLAYTHRIPIPTLDVHAIDRYLWVGELLGFDDSPADSTVYLPPETASRVDALLSRKGVPRKKLAVLVPGTIWETKHWLPERFAEVGRYLLASGFAVVIAGTPRDRVRCQGIAALAPGACDLSGETTPADLGGIIQRAQICITNDSGSMHLATALDRPVVSIFGPTNPIHIGPYRHPESVVRVDLPCSPCNFRKLSQCPHEHACMQQVTAAMVIERIEKKL